jgi:uncharacterized oligopeptide transporter (OPT) family protein
MTPDQVRSAYVLYIGAGAVAAGGIISLARSLPIIWGSLRRGLGDLGGGPARGAGQRTDRDLSARWVIGGIVLLLAAIVAFRTLHMNLLGALLIVAFGFLFVTVSSRLTGEIGSSSNPISGMTVATLLLTCLIFVLVGWTGPMYYVTALSVGAIVCIAASNGGTTSQDLKTGFLLGATPRHQQLAILIGTLASALVIGPILLRLNDASTVYVPCARENIMAPRGYTGAFERLQGPQARTDANTYRVWQKTDSPGGAAERYLVDGRGLAVYLVDPGINGVHTMRPDGSTVTKYDSPKAQLVSYIIKGILNRQLPWGLVLLGVMIAVVLELAGVSSLPFAVGVYLPISTTTPILVGGLIRRLIEWRLRGAGGTPEAVAARADQGRGVLLASGYIAGGAIAGIAIAFVAGVLGDVDRAIDRWSTAVNPLFAGPWSDLLSLIPFAALVALLYAVGRKDA